MARLPRVYIENILYYITSKGGHTQNIFLDPADYEEYTNLLSKYKSQYGFKLFAYVLMPTHLHLLIELKNNIGISTVMHDINSLYTKFFNNRYQKKGHLFQARFRSVLAEKNIYLLPLTRHIHLNPVRSGAAGDPKEYPYSSYLEFLEPEKRQRPDMRGEIEKVFTALGGREKEFDEYVKSETEREEIDRLARAIHSKRILGSKVFADNLKELIEETAIKQRNSAIGKKTRMLYMIFGGITLLVVVLSITSSSYFYRQTEVIKTEHSKSLEFYKTTLDKLKHDRDTAIEAALSANKVAEEYAWKIEVAEQALGDLEKEKQEALKLEDENTGFSWKINVSQVGGPKAPYVFADEISIRNHTVKSDNMAKEGFEASKYSKRELKNGNVVWETMQTNAKGETANWRGEWDGSIMKGMLRRRSADGVIRDYTFVSAGTRTSTN